MTLHRRSPWVARWSELALGLCLLALVAFVTATVAHGLSRTERQPYIVVTYGDDPETVAGPG